MLVVIPDERLVKYLDTTKSALDKLKVIAPERSYASDIAKDFLKMARSYYDDAVHFYREGDGVNAFACVNYAHGWLDAGARLGVFEVGEDDRLFTLKE